MWFIEGQIESLNSLLENQKKKYGLRFITMSTKNKITKYHLKYGKGRCSILMIRGFSVKKDPINRKRFYK
jgi:hypothetical protein